jgi:hypothetical protein
MDLGISGTKEKRPELDRLMADAHKRRFDVIAVWRFDRFARSTSHLLRALEQFRALGIDFVSYSEQMDTSTPTGKMVFTVLGAVAATPKRRANGLGVQKRSSMRRGLPRYAHRASAGSGSLVTWGLGLERFAGSPERVPQFRKGILESPVPESETHFFRLRR